MVIPSEGGQWSVISSRASADELDSTGISDKAWQLITTHSLLATDHYLFDAILVAGLQRAFAVFLRAGAELFGIGAAELFCAEAVSVEHLFKLAVRARDDVHADQFADAAGGGGAGIGRGFDRADIAAHEDGGISAAEGFAARQH